MQHLLHWTKNLLLFLVIDLANKNGLYNSQNHHEDGKVEICNHLVIIFQCMDQNTGKKILDVEKE